MRTTSLNFRAAAYAEENDKIPIVLLTIDHPTLIGPIRLSSDPTTFLTDAPVWATVSRGNNYFFVPFSIVIPDDKEQAPPQAKISLDNIDRSIIPLLRSTDTPATVTIEIVLSSAPDTVEIEFPTMDLVAADYDASTVTLTLSIDALMSEPYPAHSFDPAGFPALF